MTDADPAWCYLYRVTVDCSGFSSGARGRLQDINLAGRRAMFALYDDDGPGGEPQTLLDYTAAFFDSGSSGTPVIVDLPWTASPGLAAGDYWLGVCFEKTQADYFRATPAGGDDREDGMGGWVFGPPSPWRHATDILTTEGDLQIQLQFP